jgi:hypothetical protein
MSDSTVPYKTKDIYIASALLALGFILDDLTKEETIFYFNFADNRDKIPYEIQTAVEDYWKGQLLVDPKKLFTSFKEIKSRMYNFGQ